MNPVLKKHPQLIIGSVIVLIAILAIILFVRFRTNNKSVDTSAEIHTTITVTPTATTPPTITKLKSITANLPKGWSIKTYTDGQKSPEMSDPILKYSGLGAMDILNSQNKVIFSMLMATDLGGMSVCSEIPQFVDTDPAYIQSIIKINNDSLATPYPYKVVDLTKSSFKNYNLFGLPIRYVGTQLYISINPNTSYLGFDAACDDMKNYPIIRSFPQTEPIKIYWQATDSSQYSDLTPQTNYNLVSTATAADMAGLNQILSSLKAN